MSTPRLSAIGAGALALLLATAALGVPAARASDFRMPPLFSSNMVLQRGKPSTFWGWAAPGTRVTLSPGWSRRTYSVIARADGSWRIAFTPPAAPGPWALRVSTPDTTVSMDNVLVGEVWLCSGQSNMEMPLAGWPPDSPVAGSDSAIVAAGVPLIRLFTVARAFSTGPESTCTGTWVPCSPATARTFSATGFFFGRALHDALHVPVGLIHASWGGTPVEAWTSGAALSAFPEFREPLERLGRAGDSLAALNRWLHRHPSRVIDEEVPGRRWEDVTLADGACAARDVDDAAWMSVGVPGDWEDRGLGAFDGVAWYRKRVAIPRAWIGHALRLRLGPIDDMDRTFVNGRLVGERMGLDHWREPRVYAVPDSLVRDTVLQIAVRVVDFVGGGGLWGNGRPVAVDAGDSTAALSLAGDWKLLPVAGYFAPVLYEFGGPVNDFGLRPRVPIDVNASAPTVLYNGMIHPLAPFSIRGVAWYQGEENVSRPQVYARLFPAMILDWRRAFRAPDLPFDFVQIAPFAYGTGMNSQFLREAQSGALRVPHTGMAVTLDIGNAHDIHPARKREVGERLAACALAATYGRHVPHSGPRYRSMTREAGRIVLRFAGASGALVLAPGAGGSGFEIAGADGRFVPAEAHVRGRTLVVSSPDVPEPVAVRYAFSDTPAATLFDAAGLPAPPFRTDAPRTPRE